MVLVFIGLKKAFDTVDHDILCKKIEFYGAQQRELSWFRSFLANRKQFCRVNGVDSDVWDDLTQLNEAIKTWLQGNKLSLNVAKSPSMLISNKQKHNSFKSRSGALELKIRDNEL